jgi:hypothetical protein
MCLPGVRLRVRGIMFAVALATAAPLAAYAQGPYFPESVFFPGDKDLNSIVADHLVGQLKALGEPSLWKVSRTDRRATDYRFLWLAMNEHPICVRVSQSGGTISLHAARHDGSPGLQTGRVTVDRSVKLSAAQWERLVGMLEKTRFWTAPAEVKESRGIADGDKIVIDGVKEGRYHVIDRQGSTTREAYKAFCRALLDLSGEDVLKVWDRFRRGDRELRGYGPEPKETEGRGDPEPETPDLYAPVTTATGGPGRAVQCVKLKGG